MPHHHLRIFRILTLAALAISALAIAASPASATSWTSNGPKTFGGTGTTSIIYKVDTPVSGGLGGSSSSISLIGTLAGPTGPVNSGPWNGFATLRLSFAPVFTTLAGGAATANCGVATLNATGHVGHVVSGTLTNFNCAFANNGGACGTASGGLVTTVGLRITGSIPVQFDNTTQHLSLLSGVQSLTGVVSNTPGCNAVSGFTAGGSAPAHIGLMAGGVGNITEPITNNPRICSNIAGTSC